MWFIISLLIGIVCYFAGYRIGQDKQMETDYKEFTSLKEIEAIEKDTDYN